MLSLIFHDKITGKMITDGPKQYVMLPTASSLAVGRPRRSRPTHYITQ